MAIGASSNMMWLSGNTTPIPPELPENTLRIRFIDGYQPVGLLGDTLVQISESPNIWDWTCNDGNWNYRIPRYAILEIVGSGILSSVQTTDYLFLSCSNLQYVAPLYLPSLIDAHNMFHGCHGLKGSVRLITSAALTDTSHMFYDCPALESVSISNTSSVTNMEGMFNICASLKTVPSLDTSRVTNMHAMFGACPSISKIPLLNTSSVTNVDYMFGACSAVTEGALAMYQQMSSQQNVPYHSQTFLDCGFFTTTGAAELAQIPSDWK